MRTTLGHLASVKKQSRARTIFRLGTATLAGASALLALAAAHSPAQAQDASDVPGVTSVSLGGSWLEHGGDSDAYRKVDAPETDWQKVQVPGASSMAGFTWYRKHFNLPADWQDNDLAKQNLLYLHLGAIHGAAAIYLNGYLVNTVGKLPATGGTSGYQPINPTSDLTLQVPITAEVAGGTGKQQQLVMLGGDNVLAIRLYDPTAEANPQTGELRIDLPTIGELFPVNTQATNPDHLYDNKIPIAFSVLFSNNTTTAGSAVWDVNILNDAGQAVISSPTAKTSSLDAASITKANVSFDLGGAGAPAGFYTFVVDTKINNTAVPNDVLVAGLNPSAIRSDMTAPNGFGAFWNDLQTAAAAGSLNPQIDKDTAASTPDVNVYRVKFAGLGTQPALAWLSVPTNVGSKPVAILHIPAYKEDPTAPSLDMAKRGYIVMDLIANAPDYTSGNANTDYFSTGLESPSDYVFRGIEGNVLRAARLLTGAPLPGVTSSPKLVLWGESVGGALAMDSAGLLKNNVAGVVAISPYFSDVARNISTVQEVANPFHDYLTSHANARPQVNTTLGTFDTVQFAPKITAPTFIGVGLLDPIQLPYGEYAAINVLAAPHTVDVEPDAQHIPAASHNKALDWLDKTVK